MNTLEKSRIDPLIIVAKVDVKRHRESFKHTKDNCEISEIRLENDLHRRLS